MTEKQAFDAAMKKILSVSKPELQRRLELERREKTATARPKPQNGNLVKRLP